MQRLSLAELNDYNNIDTAVAFPFPAELVSLTLSPLLPHPTPLLSRPLSTPRCYGTSRQDVAAYIKKEFDKKYNPTWHCIVGRNFGSYVTHETKHFIYFYLGQVAILLFKSG